MGPYRPAAFTGEFCPPRYHPSGHIKEIVRTLSVSRATVRKVIRGHKTEFRYERGVQPTPKLGDWVEVLTEILEQEAKLPKRERRSSCVPPVSRQQGPSCLQRFLGAVEPPPVRFQVSKVLRACQW